jgi:hypothetical protein
MPAKSSTNKSNFSWKKVFIGLSVVANTIFVILFIALAVLYSRGALDFVIWNFTLNLKDINYAGSGNCLQISSRVNDGTAKLDTKGRVLSNDGKVQCLVLITPQEADAIQQKLDAEAISPTKQQ